MTSRTYGYARVSSRDQNLDRQLDAFKTFGLDKSQVFSDKASGKDFKRPQWRRLMRRLHRNDVLVIKSIDRLGRNYDEIIEEWRVITKEKGVHVVVLDMPLLDTRERPDNVTGAFIADLVLQLLSYVAQVERESIKQRQAEGIAAAKARGVRFGRPAKKRPVCYQDIKDLYREGRITRNEASARLNVSPNTFDKWLREDTSTDQAVPSAEI
ncbi:MAG: recombinase family protein [Atopobiaceae bacterium]|nr:recombinase family protein [Atopobiaceae bacterium]